MSRIVIAKNTKGFDDVWEGQPINYLQQYMLDETEFNRWATSLKVITDITAGFLTINSGTEDLDPTKGLAWLQGNSQPPVSKDGDWHFLNENFAHVTGNEGINWVIEKELEDEETYSEMFVLPPDRHATLNMLKGGSDQVPSSLVLEWFVEVTANVFMRVNPWIRSNEIIAARLNGAHSSGSTVLTVFNDNDEVAAIRRGLYYHFCDEADNSNGFYAKVTAKDVEANTITLESGTPIDLSNNSPLGLTDRVIGKIGNQIASDSLVWVSPPNKFFGNGKNYFKMTVRNEDTTKVGTITAVLNGWHSPIGGD